MDLTDVWTEADYAEYQRQLKLIKEHYPTLPDSSKEHWAAVIVNNQKK